MFQRKVQNTWVDFTEGFSALPRRISGKCSINAETDKVGISTDLAYSTLMEKRALGTTGNYLVDGRRTGGAR